MVLFGVEKWLDRGETFSVYFGMFSTPRRGRGARRPLGVRRAALGGAEWVARRSPAPSRWSWSTIGVTTFDGAAGGDARERRSRPSTAGSPTPASGPTWRCGSTELALPRRSRSLSSPASSGRDLRDAHGAHRSLHASSSGGLFAPRFIPIALAYLVAHYFSLVVFQEQAQFTYLLSDPLGDGSDFFGTAAGGIDYTAISANAIW